MRLSAFVWLMLVLTLALILGTVTGCSSHVYRDGIDIQLLHAEPNNLSQYSTYSWAPESLSPSNSINNLLAPFKQQIEDTLLVHGLKHVSERGTLTLHWVINARTMNDGTFSDIRPLSEPSQHDSNLIVLQQRYPEGSLLLALTSRQSKQILWAGVAINVIRQSGISGETTPNQTERIQYAVSALLDTLNQPKLNPNYRPRGAM